MYRNYKIVVVTPAGRQRYMEVLLPYILKNKDIVDEYHVWVNTRVESDKTYLYDLEKTYPEFIKCKFFTDEERSKKDPCLVQSPDNIRYFFQYCVEDNTIYVRLDDDIVYLDDNFFKTLLDYRIDNPQYFIVYPLIINNAGITKILVDKNIYKHPSNERIGQNYRENELYCAGYHPLDNVMWHDAYYAYDLHKWFLEKVRNKELDSIKFGHYPLSDRQYVSINSFAWFGSDFKSFDGYVDIDNEEVWFNVKKIKELNLYNSICGDCIVAHFAFWPQREHLDKTDVLNEYRNLLPR